MARKTTRKATSGTSITRVAAAAAKAAANPRVGNLGGDLGGDIGVGSAGRSLRSLVRGATKPKKATAVRSTKRKK